MSPIGERVNERQARPQMERSTRGNATWRWRKKGSVPCSVLGESSTMRVTAVG